jgi:hypothetical protein
MKDLVRLAEQREAAAKAEVAKLVPSKAAIYIDSHAEEEEQEQQQQEEEEGAEGAGEGAVSMPSSPSTTGRVRCNAAVCCACVGLLAKLFCAAFLALVEQHATSNWVHLHAFNMLQHQYTQQPPSTSCWGPPHQRFPVRACFPQLPTIAVPDVPQPFSATKPPSAISVESKRAETLRYKYGKLRSVVISAEQGLSALLQRLMVALQVRRMWEHTPAVHMGIMGATAAGADWLLLTGCCVVFMRQ